MPIATELLTYHLEIEWAVAWFPIRANAVIDAPRIRAGHIRHRNTENALADDGMFDHRVGYLLGQGPTTDGQDPLEPDNRARGLIEIDVDDDEIFSVRLQATLGLTGPGRTKAFSAGPGLLLPFMINVDSTDRDLDGTRLSLYGTIATGKRAIDKMSTYLKLAP